MSETKLNRRQFLKAASVVVAGAGLAACKAKVVTEAPQATKPPEATKPSAAPSATPPPAAPVTIEQWYHAYGEAGVEEAVYRYAKQYQEVKPNVTVNVTWMPDYSAVAAARLAGTAPDLVEQNPGPTLDDVKNGYVAPWDDVLSAEEKADFNQGWLARNTMKGAIYALLMCTDTEANTYRKSLFTEAGITAEPATMADFTAAAKACTKGAVKGLFLGNDGGLDNFYTMYLIRSAGGVLIDKDLKPGFVTQAVADALLEFKKLATSDALLIGAPTDWWDPSPFNDGLCAIQQQGLWAFPAIQKKFADDWDCFPWPAAAAGVGSPVTYSGGWAETANPKSKVLAEAKAYARWLWVENTDIQVDFNLAYGFHVPPRASVAKNAKALQSGPAAKVVANLKYAHTPPAEWNNVMNTALDEVIKGVCVDNVEPMEALQTAADKVTAEMKNVIG
jgi:multiple sugar transport system substrate-binding protein